MNQFYRLDAAAKKLEEEATAQYESSQNTKYLCAFAKDGVLSNAYVHFERDKCRYQLARQTEDGPEELVLRLSGIITDHKLPPIVQSPRDMQAIKRLRQGVMITGLDTPKFQGILAGITAIYSMFSKEIQSDNLQIWTPGRFRSWSTISIFNSYFSPGHVSGGDDVVPFRPEVDPEGILARIDQSHFRHTADNDVGYFQREVHGEKGFRYTAVSPCVFAVGDIVEARVSFLVVRLATRVQGTSGPYRGRANIKDQFRLVIVLRSLALLDNYFSKEAADVLALRLIHTPRGSSSLKRKQDFSDDEAPDSARLRVEDMEI